MMSVCKGTAWGVRQGKGKEGQEGRTVSVCKGTAGGVHASGLGQGGAGGEGRRVSICVVL